MSLPYLVTARCEIESITRKPGAEAAALTASREICKAKERSEEASHITTSWFSFLLLDVSLSFDSRQLLGWFLFGRF